MYKTLANPQSHMQGALRNLEEGRAAPVLRAVRSAKQDRIAGLPAEVAFSLFCRFLRVLLALGIALAMAGSLSISLPLLVAGPGLAEIVGRAAGLEQTTVLIWRLAYWPIVAAAALTILAAFYKTAPAHRPPFREQIPGALLGGGLWLLSALALRIYMRFALSEATFGPLAAPAALLLWLYITTLAVLAGGELNAELSQAQPAEQRRKAASSLVGPV